MKSHIKLFGIQVHIGTTMYIYIFLIEHKFITPTLYSVFSNPSTLLILPRHLLLPSLDLRKR